VPLGKGGRRLAAEQSRGLPPQGAPYSWPEPGVVATVTAGAATDGNALVTVTYRGVTVAAAYPSTYTPVVAHNVNLLVCSTGSVVILGRFIGTP
jgi:hypothetical protein